MTELHSGTARATARRLLAREILADGTSDAAALGAEHVLVELFSTLSRWVGAAGCDALFTRAFVLAAPHHSVLRDVRYKVDNGTPRLERFGDNAREYGSQATTEGATTVLASIVTMLSGLIGEDIAMSLLEEVPPGAAAVASDAAWGLLAHTSYGDAAS